jgi:catecholate siderophore receptor
MHLFLAAMLAFPIGQTPTVVLHGRAITATHAAVPGARVSAKPENGGDEVSAIAGAGGRFDLPMTPGVFLVRIEATGFTALAVRVNTADVRDTVRDFVLPIAPVTDRVTVTATAPYQTVSTASTDKVDIPLVNVPQSVSTVTSALVQDQLMSSIADVVRFVPGVTAHQGENNRDEVILRGNDTSANFFLNGVRDDVQYFRDLYDVDRVEVLKGPNALAFGRGSAGGVVNRVSKIADFGSLEEIAIEGGAFGARRFTSDLEHVLAPGLAGRLNAVYEHSGSFRDDVRLERYGVTPNVTFEPSSLTRITASYEYFYDRRTADRGVPSFQGAAVNVDPSAYFGDPDQSDVRARVQIASGMIQHQAGRLTIRDRVQLGAYDRGYQNFVPGPVSTDGTTDTLTGYRNATTRLNVFNQTDLIYVRTAGVIKHTVLAGGELGNQISHNLRDTAFFDDDALAIQVPISAPTIHVPLTFRPSATDTNDRVRAGTTAAYVQEQAALGRFVQVIGGARFDRFNISVHDNRANQDLMRTDNLWSPRAGILVTPRFNASAYLNYSVSYLPGAGDQFTSLTDVTEQLKPEKFTNYELGAKWNARYNLSVTAAVYRLDRTNTRSVDPHDPSLVVQTGSQRTSGFEAGINGQFSDRWNVAGGYAFQDAFVIHATTAAPAGAIIGQVPRHTFSLWNRFDFTPEAGVGFGVVSRSRMFAAIDDTVTLPGYVTLDAAAYWTPRPNLRLQVNVQNLLNRRYFLNADGDTNISPGSPRAAKVLFVVAF